MNILFLQSYANRKRRNNFSRSPDEIINRKPLFKRTVFYLYEKIKSYLASAGFSSFFSNLSLGSAFGASSAFGAEGTKVS